MILIKEPLTYNDFFFLPISSIYLLAFQTIALISLANTSDCSTGDNEEWSLQFS